MIFPGQRAEKREPNQTICHGIKTNPTIVGNPKDMDITPGAVFPFLCHDPKGKMGYPFYSKNKRLTAIMLKTSILKNTEIRFLYFSRG